MKENWFQAINDTLFCIQDIDSVGPEPRYKTYDSLDRYIIQIDRMARYKWPTDAQLTIPP
jgi:hypothetical protein